MVSVIIFIATRIGPDPVLAIVEFDASDADIQAHRERLGLDKPLPIQYFAFIFRALQGDLGQSIHWGVSVISIIIERIPASLELIAAAQLIALSVGLSGALLASMSHRKWIGNSIRGFSLLGLSMPNFVIALLGLLIFSVYLGILPSGGRGGIEHLLMPAFSLGWYFSAGYTRITYSSLMGVLNQEYIRLARIKGLPERIVVGKHALRNALIPVVTIAGINTVLMISASVAIEIVFDWPGLGFLLNQAARARDVNVVQGVVLLISSSMVFINLLIDILYAYLDPRIRYN
jgi:ABC-type dipeptide/oligopeptide/nickel transport system permease component